MWGWDVCPSKSRTIVCPLECIARKMPEDMNFHFLSQVLVQWQLNFNKTIKLVVSPFFLGSMPLDAMCLQSCGNCRRCFYFRFTPVHSISFFERTKIVVQQKLYSHAWLEWEWESRHVACNTYTALMHVWMECSGLCHVAHNMYVDFPCRHHIEISSKVVRIVLSNEPLSGAEQASTKQRHRRRYKSKFVPCWMEVCTALGNESKNEWQNHSNYLAESVFASRSWVEQTNKHTHRSILKRRRHFTWHLLCAVNSVVEKEKSELEKRQSVPRTARETASNGERHERPREYYMWFYSV